MENSSLPIVIVGAGISGLTSAVHLSRASRSVLVLDQAVRIGGRVQTDQHQGYLLDHGFQVLLTAYPEVQSTLDLQKLELRKFLPGALIFLSNGTATSLWDPLRTPGKWWATITSHAATIKDKWLVFKLKNLLAKKSIAEIFAMPETSTYDYLMNFGFSSLAIEQFFKPFYSGIFLENKLATSCRMFAFVFKMFGEGHAVVPAKGMQEIPNQLAAQLPEGSIQLQTKVLELAVDHVLTENGRIDAAAVIDARALHPQGHWHATATLYFEASQSPLPEQAIALMPNGKWVNNVAVMTDISPSYGPSNGKALVAVSVVKDLQNLQNQNLEKQVAQELQQLFPRIKTWQHLKTYLISQALPQLDDLQYAIIPAQLKSKSGVYVCGDTHLYGSLNAAMASGRQVAEAVLKS